MAYCPNKNLEEWKLLVSSRGEDIAYYLWDKYEGNVPEIESRQSIVKAGLKAIQILNSDKAKQIFDKGNKNNWSLEKILAELAVPREQRELIKGLGKTNLNEIVTDLLANYSYIIEINTAKESYLGNEWQIEQVDEGYDAVNKYTKERKFFIELDDAYTFIGDNKILNAPTQHYSNLTVPGGTNYTENEISIPGVEVKEEPKGTDIKPGISELFESNPELANQVYEALGFKQTITQDDKSYYRGQIEKPTIDEDGNLVLYGREDELYKRAGLKSKGTSMTDNLQSAIEYGNGQLEVAQNLASETYDVDRELERLSENGYYLIQIPKNVSNEVVKEAGEVKVIRDKIIIPKGQYKIEQVVDDVEQITPQQKQQAQQLYSQYLDTIFPNSKVKDIVYHGTNLNFDKFDKTKIGGNTAVKGEKPSFSFSNNKQQAEAYSSEITVGQNTNELAEAWFEENQHVFKNGDINTGIIDINNVFDHYKKELGDSKEMISLTREIDPVTNKYKLIPVNDKNLKELSEIKTKEWQQEYNTLLTAGARVMSAILNIKSPKIVDFKGEKKSVKFKEEQLNTKGDAFIAKNIDDWGKGDVIQVFEPEQIHILGSKQDIEGFKQWKKDNTKTVRKGAITPSIKGHAQFATDNGIGWFRSDDKISEQKKEFSDLLIKNRIEDAAKLDELRKTKDLPTKTRRILEVQSDLFQKGRDKSDLITNNPIKEQVNQLNEFDNPDLNKGFKIGNINYIYDVLNNSYEKSDETGGNYIIISKQEFDNAFESKYPKNPTRSTPQNQFLQLLNKDNNWVTFFVKSIIQSTAKETIQEINEQDVENMVKSLQREGKLKIKCD